MLSALQYKSTLKNSSFQGEHKNEPGEEDAALQRCVQWLQQHLQPLWKW